MTALTVELLDSSEKEWNREQGRWGDAGAGGRGGRAKRAKRARMVRIRGCWKHKDKGHKGKVDIGCLTPQAQAHHNHPREAYLPSIVSTRALKLPLSQNDPSCRRRFCLSGWKHSIEDANIEFNTSTFVVHVVLVADKVQPFVPIGHPQLALQPPTRRGQQALPRCAASAQYQF